MIQKNSLPPGSLNRQPRQRLTSVVAGILLLVLGMAWSPTIMLAQQTPANFDPKTVGIEIKLDKPQALVAERVHLTITVTAPKGINVNFPESPERVGEFDVMTVNDTLDIPEGSQRRWVRRLGLESLVSGKATIPPVQIGYVDRRVSPSIAGVTSTPAQSIKIGTSLEGSEDLTQFRDIKSVSNAPEEVKPRRRWVAWVAGASGLTALLALAFVLVRRKSQPSPQEWAIQSLTELRDRATEIHPEQAYVRLVEILRSYVDRQFGITAPRLTTYEFLNAIQVDDRLSPDFQKSMQALLNQADLIKFSGMSPQSHGLTDEIDNAIGLIQQTGNVEPTQSAGNLLLDPDNRLNQFPNEGGSA